MNNVWGNIYRWYLVYGLCVLSASLIIITWQIYQAYPSGFVMNDFNYYGEQGLEFVISLSALPAIPCFMRELIKELVK
jgi:hypothetical protein